MITSNSSELESPVDYDTVVTDTLAEMAIIHGCEVFRFWESGTGVTAIYKRVAGKAIVVAKVHHRGNNKFFTEDFNTWGEVEYIEGGAMYYFPE